MLKKLLFVAIIAAIIVFGVVLPINLMPDTPETNSSRPEPTSTAQPMLEVPGADAIAFEHLDFAKDSSTWVVVSKTHPLRDTTYAPADLIIPEVPGNDQKTVEEQSVRALVQQPLKDLFRDASAKGHSIMVASGYRSYSLQNQYYSNYVRTSGEAEANKFSAKPGHSEHQTGLAVDISMQSRDCYLEVCFAETSAGKWLQENAHNYGFIIRYPENKTDITGYQYEPWHIRYVGVPLATALHSSGKTLDEILPLLQNTHDELVKNGTITE